MLENVLFGPISRSHSSIAEGEKGCSETELLFIYSKRYCSVKHCAVRRRKLLCFLNSTKINRVEVLLKPNPFLSTLSQSPGFPLYTGLIGTAAGWDLFPCLSTSQLQWALLCLRTENNWSKLTQENWCLNYSEMNFLLSIPEWQWTETETSVKRCLGVIHLESTFHLTRFLIRGIASPIT